MEENRTYTAFLNTTLIGSGSLEEVLSSLKTAFDNDQSTLILTFEDRTGTQVDFDLRGTHADVLSRVLAQQPKLGPGRPKLGVVSREISLLPRHWEWLEEQPNGASAAIRRLVDEERKREPGGIPKRLATQAAGRVMSAMAGNLPGYEEASRALYSSEGERFRKLIRDWPQDLRMYLERLVQPVFAN